MKGKANEDYKCRMYGKTMQIKTKGNQDVCTQKLTASSLKLDKFHSKNKLNSHVKVNVEALLTTLHCKKIWNMSAFLKALSKSLQSTVVESSIHKQKISGSPV